MIRKQTKILEMDCTVYQLAMGKAQNAAFFADCQLPIALSRAGLPIEIKNPPRNERVHHYEQS